MYLMLPALAFAADSKREPHGRPASTARLTGPDAALPSGVVCAILVQLHIHNALVVNFRTAN